MLTTKTPRPPVASSPRSVELEISPDSESSGCFSSDWTPNYRPAFSRSFAARKHAILRRRRFDRVLFLGKVLWASPWSLWAVSIGIAALLTGGGVRRRGRIVEFWGGVIPLFLRYFPFIAGSPVATFGHVVLGRCPRHLDACRPHQLIHVKQYEQWGPLFVPTYILCWAVLWCIGKRPYYDNPFEREAYDKTGW